VCGRFSLDIPAEKLAEFFALLEEPRLEARFNIAPSQPVLAVLEDRGTRRRTARHFRWGLVPFWAKDPKIGYRMINARSEAASEKPSFRAAFKYRRCLIPATGFYEWKKLGKRKQPFMIRLAASSRLMAFAGLWESWQSPDGAELETCTILTTKANSLVADLHDRMPVILEPDQFHPWLDTDLQDVGLLRQLMQPYDPAAMTYFPVSQSLNSVANEGSELAVPIEINKINEINEINESRDSSNSEDTDGGTSSDRSASDASRQRSLF
jgi:putative SOS response-associated peptidase YedK